MHPLSSWLTLLNLSLFLPNLVYALKFINPPSITEPLSNTDYSLNPVYTEGSLLNILWDEQSENTTSVTLWQLNGTEGMQPFEHITQDVSGSVTSFTWPVQTNKNLTFSSTFYLNFFRKGPGQNYPLSTSQPFNITRGKTDDDGDSSASTTSIITGSVSTPTSSATSTPTSTSDAKTTAPAPGGLSNGAKAGIGIGVGAGSFLIIVSFVSWIVLRHQRRKSLPTDPGPAVHTGYYGLGKQHHEIDGRGKDALQVQELGGRERPVELS